MTVGLVDIPSPGGKEKEVSDYFAQWMKENGLDAFAQEVETDRSNAIGLTRAS